MPVNTMLAYMASGNAEASYTVSWLRDVCLRLLEKKRHHLKSFCKMSLCAEGFEGWVEQPQLSLVPSCQGPLCSFQSALRSSCHGLHPSQSNVGHLQGRHLRRSMYRWTPTSTNEDYFLLLSMDQRRLPCSFKARDSGRGCSAAECAWRLMAQSQKHTSVFAEPLSSSSCQIARPRPAMPAQSCMRAQA